MLLRSATCRVAADVLSRGFQPTVNPRLSSRGVSHARTCSIVLRSDVEKASGVADATQTLRPHLPWVKPTAHLTKSTSFFSFKVTLWFFRVFFFGPRLTCWRSSFRWNAYPVLILPRSLSLNCFIRVLCVPKREGHYSKLRSPICLIGF